MRWPLGLLALLLLSAGCTGNDAGDDNGDNDGNGGGTTTTTDDGHAGMTHVEVRDNYFQVQGQPATNNSETTASVGDTFMFVVSGDRAHTITIHKVGDPLDVTVLDEEVREGDEVEFTFEEATTYHVWCELHGGMTDGMHLTVVVS